MYNENINYTEAMEMNQKNQTGCAIFILFWIIITVGFAIFLMQINNAGESIGTIIFMSVIVGLGITCIGYVLPKPSIFSKSAKIRKEQRKKDKKEGITRYDMILHIAGLPILGNYNVSAALSSTELAITDGEREFVLNIDKIREVEYQFDINETQYLKSSFVKGMAGAAVMGMPGAVLGSMPTVKKKRNSRSYASIIYENVHGEKIMILLKDQYVNTKVCYQLVQKLQPKIRQQVRQVNRVEL